MESNRSQFDLLRLAPIVLAAPVVLFTIGMEATAMAQQPNLKKGQEASQSNDSDKRSDQQVRRSIIEEIQELLLDKGAEQELLQEKKETEPVETVTDFYIATAYCIKNTTACGVMVRPGIIAADPSVLPLGSIVRIEAGKYS